MNSILFHYFFFIVDEQVYVLVIIDLNGKTFKHFWMDMCFYFKN